MGLEKKNISWCAHLWTKSFLSWKNDMILTQKSQYKYLTFVILRDHMLVPKFQKEKP